jgi:hypothetical protein
VESPVVRFSEMETGASAMQRSDAPVEGWYVLCVDKAGAECCTSIRLSRIRLPGGLILFDHPVPVTGLNVLGVFHDEYWPRPAEESR